MEVVLPVKILVTGSAGFIGKHLVMRLASGDEASNLIIGLDLAPKPPEFEKLENLVYVSADIRDEYSVISTVQKYKPDIIFHLAAAMGDKCEEEPDTCLAVNVVGLNNILKAASTVKAKRVVFSSSISVYNPQVPEPVKEEMAGTPIILYGMTKYFGELLGLWYANRFGIEFVALRLSVVFGPGRTTGLSARYSSKMIEDAFRHGRVEVINPDDRVNYLFVSDAVEALVKAATVPELTSKIYNISGFEYPITEFVEILRERFPQLEVKVSPEFKSPWPAKFDTSRAKKELGWKPTMDLRAAVKTYIRCLELGDPYCYLKVER